MHRVPLGVFLMRRGSAPFQGDSDSFRKCRFDADGSVDERREAFLDKHKPDTGHGTTVNEYFRESRLSVPHQPEAQVIGPLREGRDFTSPAEMNVQRQIWPPKRKLPDRLRDGIEHGPAPDRVEVEKNILDVRRAS